MTRKYESSEKQRASRALDKTVEIVKILKERAERESNAEWGKSTGGPYPWRKQGAAVSREEAE